MKEVKIMVEDLKVEKKKEVLSQLNLKNPKEGGLDKDPLAIVKIPEIWQVRITRGTTILMSWDIGEEETDEGSCDFYLDDLSGIEEKLEDAFDTIKEQEEEEVKDKEEDE